MNNETKKQSKRRKWYMKKLEVYQEIMENGRLSVSKLNEMLQRYQEDAKRAEEKVRNTGITGDELVDGFFNELDEIPLLSFEVEEKHIDVSLGRYHDQDEETGASEFGVCYLIEEKDLDFDLEDADDFLLGQEEALITELKKLGYEES